MSVRFKDLCLDVADPTTMGRFWSATLGLTAEPRGEDVRLGDDIDEHALWLNRVPEPKTVKHRVHLDVYTASIAELVERGATVIDDSHPWTILADPEGGEFCAHVREATRAYSVYVLCVDCADPQRLAGWWAERLGVEARTAPEHAFWWLPAQAGLPWEWVFLPVPEPKQGKNRWHWDVWGDVAELTAAGATLVRARDDEIAWDVLEDPEGNIFCAFPFPAG